MPGSRRGGCRRGRSLVAGPGHPPRRDLAAGTQFHLEEGPERQDWINSVAESVNGDTDFAALSQLVDMDEFTTYMAIEALVLWWDGCESPNNGRLQINSAGIGRWVPTGVDYSWSYSSGDCWYGNRTVFRACKTNESCRAMYAQELIDMADLIDSMYLVDEFEDLTAFLAPEIETDARTPHNAGTIAAGLGDTKGFLESNPERCRQEAEQVPGL